MHLPSHRGKRRGHGTRGVRWEGRARGWGRGAGVSMFGRSNHVMVVAGVFADRARVSAVSFGVGNDDNLTAPALPHYNSNHVYLPTYPPT